MSGEFAESGLKPCRFKPQIPRSPKAKRSKGAKTTGERLLYFFIFFVLNLHYLTAQTLPIQVFPAEVITLDSLQDYEIMQQCAILRDASGAMTFADVLAAAQKGAFTPVGKTTVRVRGREAVWMRFTVRNTKLSDWVLLVGNSRIDSAILYTPNTASNLPSTADDYIRSISGELTELRRSRAMQTKHAAFPLALADENTYTFYVRINALYTPALPTFRITPAEAFTESARLWEIVASVLLGMLLFAAAFNIVPLVIMRDAVYFWYIAHVLSLFAFCVFSATLLSERVLPLAWRPLADSLVQLSTYAVFMQFARVFLDVRNRMPRVFDILMLASICAMLALPLFIPLGWEAHYTYWRVLVLMVSGVLLLVILFREMWFSRDTPTRIYTLTMICFVGMKFVMFIWGTVHEAVIVSTVGVGETLLFSFALAARMNQMRVQMVQERRDRELAQKLREQEQIRNKELASANEEIRRQNVILEEQSREIELTNTHLNEVILELDTALTDLKETQTQLVASERLSAVGMLTAGVMHEINNPNAAVYAALEQMRLKEENIRTFFLSLISDDEQQSPEAKRFIRLTDEIRHMIGIALEGSNRVKQIVSSLRTFTKHQEDGIKSAPLKDELASTLEMFRYQFKNVDIRLEYIGDTTIEANFGEINQVFLNLFVNAAQAGASVVTLHTETRASGVEARVIDNGGGIPQEVLERIFEPFYTTKGTGNSGLGLSISKRIIEKHRATMQVKSRIGEGTTFILTFPLPQALSQST